MSGDIMSEFKCHLNCAAPGEHVPEAERSIRVIKERIGCVVNTWPFKQVPQVFKINLIKYVIFWLNSIPHTNTLITNVCSRAIITGQFPDFTKHCKVGFGTYVHVHNPRNITNTMDPRTSPAVALGPVPNLQGSQRFFCLTTRKVITRRQWIELPTPASVIAQVNDIAMKERGRMKPNKYQDTISEEYHISHQLTKDHILNMKQNYVNPVDQTNNKNTQKEHDPISPTMIKAPTTPTTPTTSTNDDASIQPDDDTSTQSNDNKSQDDTTEETDPAACDQPSTNEHDNAPSNGPTNADHNPGEKQVTEGPTHRYNTRNRSIIRPPQYNKVYGNDYTFAVTLTQMSASRGIKKFGQKALDALASEWQQLDLLSVFKGREYESLTSQQRRSALGTVQLIKAKKDGRIKGRACVNGSRQRMYTAEEDASSPTVSTEALLITATIDAAKQRHVATCDITGAFLKADMDDFVLIALRDKEIDALVQANDKYQAYVKVLPNGKRVIYLELVKAMYGCLKSARLFWDHLSNHLSKMGFTQNNYDLCVANKTIDNNVCTIAWHVDDLKITHKDELVVQQVIKEIEKEYGEMSVTTGPVHSYCGMKLIFENKQVKIEMIDFLNV